MVVVDSITDKRVKFHAPLLDHVELHLILYHYFIMVTINLSGERRAHRIYQNMLGRMHVDEVLPRFIELIAGIETVAWFACRSHRGGLRRVLGLILGRIDGECGCGAF